MTETATGITVLFMYLLFAAVFGPPALYVLGRLAIDIWRYIIDEL